MVALLSLIHVLYGGVPTMGASHTLVPAACCMPDSGLAIVSLDSAPDKPLRDILLTEIKHARALGRTPFLELGATWCAPCHVLQTVLDTKPTDPLVLREFAGTYLIRLDVDQWHREFESVGIPASGGIPAFFAIDTTGQVTDTFSGDSVRAMTPEGLRPVEAFFHAHLWKHDPATQPRRTQRWHAHAVPTDQRLTEDQVFDANHQSPVALLRSLYEKNQVLVIAFSSHDSQKQYQMLDSLLQQVGRDPRLKRIVLERGGDAASLLEQSSTTPVPIADVARSYSSAGRAQVGLCLDGEFAYTWSDFLPRIRALNATRNAKHPVLVTSVDAVDFNKVVKNGQIDMFAFIQFAEGESREVGTSANFYNRLWKPLGPNGKIIMLYHYAHVIKTFTVLNEQRQRVPKNWMSTFLRDHPKAESHIGIVLLDADAHSFAFTQRQAARYPDQTFAVALAPFRGVTMDRDTAVFAVSSSFPLEAHGPTFGTAPHSSRTFSEMFDGVIWIADAKQWVLKTAHDYLPAQCP